jgi:hypothetical protein
MFVHFAFDRPSDRPAPCRTRRRFFPLLAGGVFILFLGIAVPSVVAQEAEEIPVSPTSEAKVSIPVVEGQDLLGLRIPHHNEHGELVMLITADVARRLDDQHVEMERMRIDLFDDDRQRIELAMPESQFNLDTRILRGEKGGIIRRDDFTIEGEILEFDLAEQIGRMEGEITMIIFSTEDITP